MRKFFRQIFLYIYNSLGSWDSINITVTRLHIAQPKN
jgi:hypothetical protein